MARKIRVHYSGAIYHVMVRGNNREAVFLHDEDKKRYLELFRKYRQKYAFSIYAYALMNNHVHILLTVDQEPLGKIMQGIQQSYTQYFNRKYGRVGHVFEQRYKAKLCGRDEYLLTLLKYIHRNSQEAGITSGIDYPWSSHSSYCSGNSHLVNPAFLLGFFDDKLASAIKKYLAFMEEPEPQLANDIHITYAKADTIMDRALTQPASVLVSVEELLDITEQISGVSKEKILRERYIRKSAVARALFIYLAISHNQMSKTELSNMLLLSVPAVIKSYNKISQNAELEKRASEYLSSGKVNSKA